MRFPIVGDIVDWIIGNQAAGENQEKLDQMLQQLYSMNAPNFSNDQYNPQMTSVPYNVDANTIKEDPALRQKQMDVLNNLQDISNGKISAQRDLDRYKAIQDANSMAQARDQAALQQAQARGVGGGGLEFIMRQQSGQDAANRLQQADMSSAAQAALERLQATGQLQSGLSNLRGQDFNTNQENTNIINKFNLLNSTRNQEALDKQAMLRNEAQQFNMNRNDRNTQIANQVRNQNIMNQVRTAYPAQQEQIGLKYAPLYRLNDAWSNDMGNLVASGIGGGYGGQVGGAMGGQFGSAAGSMIGSKAAQSLMSNKGGGSEFGGDEDLMNWGLE